MTTSTEIRKEPLILIADDDPTHRMVLQEVLQQTGFRVLTAPNGQAALDIYNKVNPDVVLLDVDMPLVDGFEVCEAIRAEESVRQTPIFIVTGLEDDESVKRAYELGATDFISKPITWPVLPHRIRYVLKANGALNDLRGLIRAVPDLIFVVDANGDVREQISTTETNHTQQLRALTTASQIDFYPC